MSTRTAQESGRVRLPDNRRIVIDNIMHFHFEIVESLAAIQRCIMDTWPLVRGMIEYDRPPHIEYYHYELLNLSTDVFNKWGEYLYAEGSGSRTVK